MTVMDVDQHDSNESQVPAGISYPPPHIRASIERSAANLAFREPEREFFIRQADTQGIYSFLHPNDPYYPYYRFRLQEIKEEAMYQESPRANNQRDPVKIAPKELGPEELLQQISVTSTHILDVVQLVAHFAARMGYVFIDALLEDENSEPLFSFVLSFDRLYPLFIALVKQYKKDPVPLPADIFEILKANGNSRYYSIIERAKERAEWIVSQEPETQEHEKERVANANIDWNGAVVAEAVAFTVDDERIELTPPPMSSSELGNMSLVQKRLTAMPAEAVLPKESQDVVMEVEGSPQITPPQSPENSDQADYKSESLAGTPTSASARICPRCRASVPVDEMVEHMRVELIDPKWEAPMEARKRKSGLVKEDWDVSKRLKTVHPEQ